MPTGTRSKVREIIKAEEIVNLLQNNVLDKDAPPLNQNKLHAAKILLAKCLPDLKALEVDTNLTGSVEHKLIQVEFIAAEDIEDS